MDLKKELDDITIAIDSIADPVAKIIIARLLNIIEEQAKIIMELKTENQKLRDENNRLKGEQGKPNIRPQSGNSKNISSETERKRKTNNKKKKSKKKKHKIKVNRIVKCEVDKSQLPSDATFKGYQSVIVQDITLITNNIKFRKEVYYSSSLKKLSDAHIYCAKSQPSY